MLQNAPATPAQPAIYSLCAQYPLMPPGNFAAVNVSVVAPQHSELFAAAIASHHVAQAQTKPQFNGCLGRSHQKRGPPTFLS